jgi:hypothetical protein
LLNWGFSTGQIRTIWSTRDAIIPEIKPESFFETSEDYLNSPSCFPCDAVNEEALYYPTIPLVEQLPHWDKLVKRYLGDYSLAALRSWGFSERLISQILTERPGLTSITIRPDWLELNPLYISSSYKMADNVSQSSQVETQSTNPSPNSNVDSDWFNFTSPPHTTPQPAPYIPTPSPEEPEEEEWDNRNSEDEDEDSEEEGEEYNPPIYHNDLNYETAHDLQVKYLNTYGLYGSKPAYIADIITRSANPSGYAISAQVFNENGIKSITSKDISDFNMIIPKLGFINYKNMVVHLERKHKKSSPSRYRKGLRADTLTYLNLSAYEYKEAYSLSNPVDTYNYGEERVLQKILAPLFFPVYPTYQEAIDSLISFKKLSCAISTTLALSLDFKTNKILLWRNKYVMGYYTPSLCKFILTTDLFKDEIKLSGVPVK